MIFDLDGTLVETERLKALSYARAAAALRPEIGPDAVLDAYRMFVGRPREEVAQGLLARFNLGDAARGRTAEFGVREPWEVFSAMRLRDYEATLADEALLRAHAYPRAIALLRAVRRDGYRTALCSMSYRDQVERVLDALDLAAEFDVVLARDDVRRPKPDPEIDLEAARRLGLVPAACLVIEDSPIGVRAAQAAGMAVIAVPTLFTREAFRSGGPLDPRWVVDDPADLAAVARERLEAGA
jgi:beta-phosphoglucomutase